MALADKLHHTQCAQSGEAARRPTGTEDGEGYEYKKNALSDALRGQKTLLPGMRTVSTAPLPQVPSPTLVAKWSTTLHWSPSCARLFWRWRRRRGREKETVKEQEEQKKEWEELCTLRASLAQLCGDNWKQSQTPFVLLFGRGLVRHAG